LAARVVASWQHHVRQLVRAENVTKRSIARVASFDDESLALVLSIGVLSYEATDAAAADGAFGVPQQMLTELFGAGLLRDMGSRIRQDLRERVTGLFEAEARRYFAVIDSTGIPQEAEVAELLEASDALEAAR
jgi:hypothetical protein